MNKRHDERLIRLGLLGLARRRRGAMMSGSRR